MPGNLAGTAKTLIGSNAVGVGGEGGLLRVPGLAHINVGCTASQGYVSFGSDATGELFVDDSISPPSHSHSGPGGSLTIYFGSGGGTDRFTFHYFVGTPGSVNGQTFLSITLFGTQASPCLFTATALLQSNAS